MPCIIRHPGRVGPGTIVREVATTMDLLPTIASWTGDAFASPRKIDGHDIGPMLADPSEPTPTAWFLYYTAHGDLAGIREGRWKLLLESGTLHDLEVDPGERWDRAKARPAIVERLRARAVELDGIVESPRI